MVYLENQDCCEETWAVGGGRGRRTTMVFESTSSPNHNYTIRNFLTKRIPSSLALAPSNS